MSAAGGHARRVVWGAWCDREAEVEKDDENVEPPAAGEEAGGLGEGDPSQELWPQSSGKRSAVQA